MHHSFEYYIHDKLNLWSVKIEAFPVENVCDSLAFSEEDKNKIRKNLINSERNYYASDCSKDKNKIV